MKNKPFVCECNYCRQPKPEVVEEYYEVNWRPKGSQEPIRTTDLKMDQDRLNRYLIFCKHNWDFTVVKFVVTRQIQLKGE